VVARPAAAVELHVVAAARPVVVEAEPHVVAAGAVVDEAVD
jgi:hypothetical protein